MNALTLTGYNKPTDLNRKNQPYNLLNIVSITPTAV